MELTLLLCWTNLIIIMTVVNKTSRTCTLIQIWVDVMVDVMEGNLTNLLLEDINLIRNKVNLTTINIQEAAILNNNTNSNSRCLWITIQINKISLNNKCNKIMEINNINCHNKFHWAHSRTFSKMISHKCIGISQLTKTKIKTSIFLIFSQ